MLNPKTVMSLDLASFATNQLRTSQAPAFASYEQKSPALPRLSPHKQNLCFP